MKRRTIIIALWGICFISVNAQDMFNVRRLTFDPAQEAFPSWSPDGKSIVYQYTNLNDSIGKNGLWKISADGLGPIKIFSGLAEHPKWSPDGRFIVFDADTGSSIKIIPSGGGDPIIFLPDSIHIMNGGLPCWSPDASQIAFLEGSTMSVYIYNMNTGSLTRIFREEGMLPLPGCWSNDGMSLLIALMDRQTRKSTIWKISSDGKERKQITGHNENLYRYLALSPDGLLLVYAGFEGRYLGLYIMPAKGGPSLPLAVTPRGNNEGASWSPDGKWIAFNSTRSENADVWIMEVNIEQVKKELGLINHDKIINGIE